MRLSPFSFFKQFKVGFSVAYLYGNCCSPLAIIVAAKIINYLWLSYC